jgi:CDP-diacylglycerol pyrophosphatase
MGKHGMPGISNLLARVCGKLLALACGILLALVCAAPPARAQVDRDILWKIVSNCIAADAGHAQACPAPRQQGRLPAGDPDHVCRRSTEVWGEAPGQFVAIRDIKMCACVGNRGFVHGLAIPLNRVPGVEGAGRPDGIWQFAWNVALDKVGPGRSSDIGLAVNPRGRRGQDQLHIHIVRLRADYLRTLDAHPEYVLRTAQAMSLDQVWHLAPPPAAADGGFADFGLLVTGAGAAGYTVRVLSPAISPEGEFTQYQCP